MDSCKIEFSKDLNEVCIIPEHLPLEFFGELVKMLGNLGYKHWIAADERCGYRFVKEIKDGVQKNHNSSYGNCGSSLSPKSNG